MTTATELDERPMAKVTTAPTIAWLAEPSEPAPSTRDSDRRPLRWVWRLGSIFGIEVNIHATFLILLGWVALSHLVAGHGLRVAFDGVALILAIFGIVVLHELGHALMARRFAIRTRDITLLPIGGVARLDRIPEQPMQELLVALAGPAVNVVLACAIADVIMLSGGSFDPADMQLVGGAFLTKLFWANVSLAIFNLLPAFPMDGGRVLRAALAFRMEHARATEVAARIGQGMAFLFGILGLFTNPMLLLIAFFVWVGAQQESSLVHVKAALQGLPVRSAMVTEFDTLAPSEPLGRAAELMLAGFQHDFPVVVGRRPIGVLTRDDIVRGLADGGKESPVVRFMHTNFSTSEESQLLEDALGRLSEHEVASQMVLRDGRVVGILTPENIGELVVMHTAIEAAESLTTGRLARYQHAA